MARRVVEGQVPGTGSEKSVSRCLLNGTQSGTVVIEVGWCGGCGCGRGWVRASIEFRDSEGKRKRERPNRPRARAKCNGRHYKGHKYNLESVYFHGRASLSGHSYTILIIEALCV